MLLFLCTSRHLDHIRSSYGSNSLYMKEIKHEATDREHEIDA